MTKSLRSWHFSIWLVLAILLPISIIIAWWAIPITPIVMLPERKKMEILPLKLQSQETPQHIVTIRANADKTILQLQWKNKTALTVPSAIIYLQQNEEKDITNSLMVGRIEARGEYNFPIKKDEFGNNEIRLVVYDFIHGVVIERLTFKI